MSTTSEFLQVLLRKETRSLLQYASESFPWAPAKHEKELKALRHMAKTELEGLALLAKVMSRHKIGIPFAGAYPQSFTTMNFIDWSFFLPLLIADQKERIEDLQEGLGWL